MSIRQRQLLTGILTGLAIIPAVGVWACSTPVYRYAIERWYPDVYRLEVTHTGPMTPSQQAAVEWLKEHSVEGEALANVYVKVIDPTKVVEASEDKPTGTADGKDSVPSETRKEAETAVVPLPPSKPGIAVYFPDIFPGNIKVWEGEFTKKAIAVVLDSPSRHEIAKKLIDGTAAVWVLLESGDKVKDDAAEEIVRTRLTKLQEELEMPADPAEGGVEDGDEGEEAAALALKFDVVRVSRKDPKEAFFVASLLKTEPDLHEFTDPMLFPIFGRGRVLYALVGKGINEDNIAEACVFMSGACSCQVKAQNPGMDVIMTAHWDRVLAELELVEDPELPPLTGVMPFSGPEPEPEVEKKLAAELAEVESSIAVEPIVESRGPGLSILAVLAIGLIVVVVVSLSLSRSKSD